MWKLLAVGMMAATAFGWMPMSGMAQINGSQHGQFHAQRILVQPRPGLGAGALADLHNRKRARVLHKFAAFQELQVIELPAGQNVLDAVREYQASGLVLFAEPDYVVHAVGAIPNDPRYADGTLWSLNNTGQGGRTPGADIDAPEGWGILHDATNVIVAIVDSGLRITHEDLAANLWVNPNEIANNGLDDDGNGVVDDVNGVSVLNGVKSGVLTDEAGHGTHVAGIIGAVGNNGVGMVGVCWRVKLMACKFMDASGNGYISDAVTCIDYARSKGAKVINCSFGSSNSVYSLQTALNNCRTAGIVVVAAAGNDGSDNDALPFYPASYTLDNIVSVAASDGNDALAWFSNYGQNSVDVAAPGYVIYSTYPSADNGYTYLSGTSMAAPLVSGVLALMRARYPLESPAQLLRRLYDAADRKAGLAGKCVTGGRVNLFNALNNYQMLATNYNWISTNGHVPLTLADNGVSDALPLPFVFNFYGSNWSNLYVGANGLLGFESTGLDSISNNDLAGSSPPNSVLCPFWDDLNPEAGGAVTYGVDGSAPNRRFVVTWSAVPHKNYTSTKFTFQAVLEESSQRILFQYQETRPDRYKTAYGYVGGGGRATVGIKDSLGAKAVNYEINGVPRLVSNATAIVFVPLPAEAMAITPAAGFASAGNAGGPFTPSSQTYTLANNGNVPLNWQGAVSQPWLSLSASNGLLGVGASTNVTLYLNAQANALPGGNYAAQAVFYNNGNSNTPFIRSISLAVAGTNALLSVAPASSLVSTGYVGGPFSPASQLYTVMNPGDAPMSWVATPSDGWLTVTPGGGTLSAGGAVTMIISINTAANSLQTGRYTNRVFITNLTTGAGSTSRVVELEVLTLPALLSVSPDVDFYASGIAGGPFEMSPSIYTLSNAGLGSLVWEVGHQAVWLAVSPENGSLAPGQSVTVNVMLSGDAAGLPPGVYHDVLVFTNKTSGAGSLIREAILTIYPPPGVLQVDPINFLALTGYVGGVFAPDSVGFKIENVGGSNLAWRATADANWLSLSLEEGVLEAGEVTNITVFPTAQASALPAGQYTNTIIFTNMQGSVIAPQHEVTLTMFPKPFLQPIYGGRTPEDFRFYVVGQPGHKYVLEVSQNFTNWVGFLTNTVGSNGFTEIVEPVSHDVRRQFYRLRVPNWFQ